MQWRPLLFAVLVAAGLATVVVGFMQAQTDDDGQAALPVGVERVIPGQGQLVLRQSQIGVDLAPGYEGVLEIDATEIPEDQLTIDRPLNQVFYTPGPNKDIEQFAPGDHTATAIFWKIVEGRDKSTTFFWRFRVS